MDVTVLGGMSFPTAGFDARSEPPTDPTATLWRVSRSNLRGDADFLKNQVRLSRGFARGCMRSGGFGHVC